MQECQRDFQVLLITTCVNKLCCTSTVTDSAFLLKNEPKCLQLVTIFLWREGGKSHGEEDKFLNSCLLILLEQVH